MIVDKVIWKTVDRLGEHSFRGISGSAIVVFLTRSGNVIQSPINSLIGYPLYGFRILFLKHEFTHYAVVCPPEV